jgi:NAD(P)-dependent dehydrogenase (short-subunit alcohol dehydrogenase family)
MTIVDVFGATSTTDEVLSGVDLHGKRILVTGVSAGLGVETARSLVAHGAKVVGAARDLTKAETATAQVRKDAAANGGSFELVGLDLGSLKSVRGLRRRPAGKGRALRRAHRQRRSNGHTV